MKRGRKKPPEDINWLYDCGWNGWVYDVITFIVTTSHGENYKPADLRQLLSNLKTWPRSMNIPKFKDNP